MTRFSALSVIATLIMCCGVHSVYAQDDTSVTAPQVIKCGAQVSKGETRCYAGAKINDLMYIDSHSQYEPYYIINGTYKADYISAQPKTQVPDNIICPGHIEIRYSNVDYPQLDFVVYSIIGVYADTDNGNWYVSHSDTYQMANCDLSKHDCPLVYRPQSIK
jgi:hypothetical protein